MYENDIRAMGTVVSSGLGSSEGGTEQVAVCFEYLDHNKQPQRITWYGYFKSEKSCEIANDALKALGWDPVENSFSYDVLNIEGETNPIIGKRASLVLGEEEYNGEVRLKVKFVNSAGGGLGLKERMAPDAAKSFAARMRARMTGGTVATPRPQPAVPRPAPAPAPAAKPSRPATDGVNFDDIPFAFIFAMLTIVGGAMMA